MSFVRWRNWVCWKNTSASPLHSRKLDSSKLMVGIKQRFLSPGLRVGVSGSLGVSRLALHNVLLAAATSRGANIRMGVTVASFEEQTKTLNVTLSDGASDFYDLLIGCDGAHSRIRTLMLGSESKPR